VQSVPENIEVVEYSYLVIGAGLAGLNAALELADDGSVLLVCKEGLLDSNTFHAQGGIAVVLSREDTKDLHVKDTLTAGAGLCHLDAVRILVEEGPTRVRELINRGVFFDHDEQGLSLTREGGHSRHRILHAHGDATGREIAMCLGEIVSKREDINIWTNTELLEIVLDEDGIAKGALFYCKEMKKPIVVQSKAVVLATGGAGQLYFNSTNPQVASGDGVAAAYRAGAKLMDLEFFQFHPTVFYKEGWPRFLVSEAVRGEGAILVNKKGERFMEGRHPLGELAPRDVVVRGILFELEKSKEKVVYLDTSVMKVKLSDRFPKIYQTLKQAGLDPENELIPVAPAAHYFMGGILTDGYGESSVPNLYACGEVACTGVHGANRLASNSLLEAAVFSHRAAQKIIHSTKKAGAGRFISSALDRVEVLPKGRDIHFKAVFESSCSTIRHKEALVEIIGMLENELDYYHGVPGIYGDLYTQRHINMCNLRRLIAKAALQREESRGAHFRLDFPNTSEKWRINQIVFNREGEEIWAWNSTGLS
jgi:L-aspartate oxidase